MHVIGSKVVTKFSMIFHYFFPLFFLDSDTNKKWWCMSMCRTSAFIVYTKAKQTEWEHNTDFSGQTQVEFSKSCWMSWLRKKLKKRGT